MKLKQLKAIIKEVLMQEADTDDIITKDEIKQLRNGVAKVVKSIERDLKDAQGMMKDDPEGYVDASYIKMLKDDMRAASKIAQITSVKKLAKTLYDMDTSPREHIENALPRSLLNRLEDAY